MDNNSKFLRGVSHSGIVSKMVANHLEIALSGNIHCESCQVKSACGVSETETKIVRVLQTDASLSVGQQVRVVLQNSLGLKAVFLAYVLPFLLLFVVLITASLFVKEWQAGLLALFVLIPYYMLLYFNKNTLKKVFSIHVLKH